MCITGLGYCILLLRDTVHSFDVSLHLHVGKPDTILLGRGGEGCPSVGSQPFYVGGGGLLNACVLMYTGSSGCFTF